MKRTLLLLLTLVLLLTSCSVPRSVQSDTDSDPQNIELELTDTYITELLGGQAGVESMLADMAYTHSSSLGTQETVAAYIEQMYLSYSRMSYIDYTSLLDTSTIYNQHAQAYLKILVQRRRLIKENNFCYVETNKYPYTIQFLEENQLEDDRINFWKNRSLGDGAERYVHFTIKGQAGKTYPPMMAVNTQQTIRLRKIDGMWKITYHYYPGCVYLYYSDASLTRISDADMLSQLRTEFGRKAAEPIPSVPDGARPYRGSEAASYATKYAETRNPNFYNNKDWIGNCANFTSQAIWYGFNDGQTAAKMPKTWFAGSGGGSIAWENVESNWNYLTGNNELGGVVISGVSNLKAGDLIQTRFKRAGAQGYNHTLMVVDADKLLLAQNSPDALVYYSDLANVSIRFFRPVYLEQAQDTAES